MTEKDAVFGAPASQRVDKWLWCARLFKTRTLAAKAVAAGGMRLVRAGDTIRLGKPSALIRPGDQITFMQGEQLKMLEVVACGERRGPASEAQLLYADHSPPPPEKSARILDRDKGAGRPTKKERRATDRWQDDAG